MRDRLVNARWWLSYPLALLLLAALDGILGWWQPNPLRLPEQFSPAFLQIALSRIPRDGAIVFLGDSVLWGYEVESDRTAAALLRARHPAWPMANLSYEGGSPPNSFVLLRELLRENVRPRFVVANVNVKEFNAADSAYKTLHPSLERLTAASANATDRNLLTLHMRTDLNARLDDWVERWWRFYRLRSDLREAIFGRDDAAGALAAFVRRLTGEAATESALHRPTPDRFLGTYDLSPIAVKNVAFVYYRAFVDELCANHIRALLFLTPTNHRLLHDYVDDPSYDANLRRLQSVPHCANVRILNWDRAIPPEEFIDNDHLTPAGQERLAQLLSGALGTSP